MGISLHHPIGYQKRVMARDNFHVKLVAPIAVTSFLMFALCTLLAVLVFRQQRGLSKALGENVESRAAAARLEEELVTLINLLRAGQLTGCGPLHVRINANLNENEKYADKERERALKREIEESFRRYVETWQQATAVTTKDARKRATEKARELLETETLKPCRKLRDYNVGQIEESELQQRNAVARL